MTGNHSIWHIIALEVLACSSLACSFHFQFQMALLESLGCYNNCGYTTCQDSAYNFMSSITVNSGCYHYSAFSNYLATTIAPQVPSKHQEYGLDSWASQGYSAYCEATILDYAIYDYEGSYSCVTSVNFVVSTQLACRASTGAGSCGGGSPGGGGSVGGGDSNPMCTPYCMCLNRIAIGGSSSSSCSHYGLSSSECG